jgi:hypothetical protein
VYENPYKKTIHPPPHPLKKIYIFYCGSSMVLFLPFLLEPDDEKFSCPIPLGDGF